MNLDVHEHINRISSDEFPKMFRKMAKSFAASSAETTASTSKYRKHKYEIISLRKKETDFFEFLASTVQVQ